MIFDGLLLAAAAAAWTWVLWFYGRAEYREPRWGRLFLLAVASFACFWIPWAGWLAAPLLTFVVLRRAFDFPAPAARHMAFALLALYMAVWLLFAFAGSPPPAL